jgi:hypothetical protein
MTDTLVPLFWLGMCFVCWWMGYFIGRGTEALKAEALKAGPSK